MEKASNQAMEEASNQVIEEASNQAMEIDLLQPQKQVIDRALYRGCRRCVWVLKIKSMVSKRAKLTSILTGFAVSRKGYIMTCSHGEWANCKSNEIKARPLLGKLGFEFEATVVSRLSGCDMCLIKVNTKILKKNVAKFGSGILEVNDPIMLLANPGEFVASGVVGKVTYPCMEDTSFQIEDVRTCGMYKSTALRSTPSHRIMGHVWNKLVFQERKHRARDFGEAEPDLKFEKNLVAHIPIIQCVGIAGGEGALGGPMFDVEGRVVGMLVSGSNRFEFGIHVSALKKFLITKGIQPM